MTLRAGPVSRYSRSSRGGGELRRPGRARAGVVHDLPVAGLEFVLVARAIGEDRGESGQ